MIRKVALVQALREAYPGAYGGIYDSDEMPAARVAEVPPAPAGGVLSRRPCRSPSRAEAPVEEPVPVVDDGPDEYVTMDGNCDEAAEAVDF